MSRFLSLRGFALLSYYVWLCLWLCSKQQTTEAFAPIMPSTATTTTTQYQLQPFGTTFQQQQYEQRSMKHRAEVVPTVPRGANMRLYGLFGLGAPELVVILIAAAFLLGPQKLAELGKDAGKIAGELKEVPKEFQAGLVEGEKLAKAAKEVKTPADSAVQDAEKE